MKRIILVLLSGVILASCGKKKVVEEPKDDFLKVPSYETVSQERTYTPPTTYIPATTATRSTTVPTYWYITFTKYKDSKDESDIDWHRAIMLNTPYFDFVEAMKQFKPEATGKCYVDFIVQIDKESYDSFLVYKKQVDGK